MIFSAGDGFLTPESVQTLVNPGHALPLTLFVFQLQPPRSIPAPFGASPGFIIKDSRQELRTRGYRSL